MLKEAIRLERSQVLEAAPYERSEKRLGYGERIQAEDGGQAPRVAHRAGPPVGGEVECYPSALERGVRSERTWKLAIAEMYVQGVSTRKVTGVREQLGGLEVSSTQVSRASPLLD